MDEGRSISVTDALAGINRLIAEGVTTSNDSPPLTAEPITRQFLSICGRETEIARDQMQKMLRGSGITPDEFTTRGWAIEKGKVFHNVDPRAFARDWQGRHKRRLSVDLDQALVLIGACYDGSGINAADTLKNASFRQHPALNLRELLEWLGSRRPSEMYRDAASRALHMCKAFSEKVMR